MNINWAFQRNEDGSSQGWNDPSIAEFKANRLESLTREIIQNSLDAAANDAEPVHVVFEEGQIKAEDLPNIEYLRDVVKLCERETDLQNPDMIKEFAVAKEVIKRTKISILSVSDYNTKGMAGPCEPGKPFYQYLKTVGQSGGNTNRAGSHGLGKAAPLACSDLRTIFVSTVWTEKKKTFGLVQGRAVLMSFRRKDGIYKSTGYWGDADQYQALTPDQVPDEHKWLLRSEVGTTVHIVGWNRIVSNSWEKLIIGYAISNFFAAFMRGKLVVRINNFEVNEQNVFKMANSEAIAKAMSDIKALDRLEDARFYMRCLADKDNIVKEETQLIHLGRTAVRMLITDEAPKKIALIRNNMLITDVIPGFWKRVPGRFRDFVGVVEVLDPTGSQFIRLMEPPSHNSLSKDWLPTAEERERGELVLDKLSAVLKGYVERYAGSTDATFGQVDFMAEFFADEAGDDRGQKIGDEIDPNGNFMFSPKPIKLPPLSKITLESEFQEEMDDAEALDSDESDAELEDGGATGENAEQQGSGFGGGKSAHQTSGGPNDGNTSNVGQKPKTDKERDKPQHPLQLTGVRFVKVGERKARMFATSSGNAKALLRVHEVGSDFDDPFDVIEVDGGSVNKGGIEVDLKEKQRLAITVTLSRAIVGGLKIVASQAPSSGEKK
jgi:hypothetical protein